MTGSLKETIPTGGNEPKNEDVFLVCGAVKASLHPLIDNSLPKMLGHPGMPPDSRFRRVLPWTILGVGLVASALLNLMTGSLDLSVRQVLAILLEPLTGPEALGSYTAGESAVIWSLRLPRVVLAMVVGGGLAMAGAAIQGLFRNPLADPALIGVTSGGAMGAILAIVGGSLLAGIPLWLYEAAIPIGALLGALSVTAVIYRLATFGGRTSVSTLLLVGIAINALAGAMIGFTLFFSSSDDIRSFLFWTLGSLDRATWKELRFALVLVIPALLVLPFYARSLNVLLLGESEAFHLGIRVQSLTRQVVFLAAGLAGVTVALAGTIGFVGLVVPHIIRLWLGPDYRRLFPACALAGGGLLLLADTAARSMAPPSVLPVGILTALAGAPFFLFLLARRRRNFVL